MEDLVPARLLPLTGWVIWGPEDSRLEGSWGPFSSIALHCFCYQSPRPLVLGDGRGDSVRALGSWGMTGEKARDFQGMRQRGGHALENQLVVHFLKCTKAMRGTEIVPKFCIGNKRKKIQKTKNL